ncbi:hypothetical protein NQZ68_035560 [Dissostichus eleginoides]|nr:hypothetical protein NQZ68_035560 [Dissostichus eleginoides]
MARAGPIGLSMEDRLGLFGGEIKKVQGWTWPHISPDACCDHPTIPDTPPPASDSLHHQKLNGQSNGRLCNTWLSDAWSLLPGLSSLASHSAAIPPLPFTPPPSLPSTQRANGGQEERQRPP